MAPDKPLWPFLLLIFVTSLLALEHSLQRGHYPLDQRATPLYSLHLFALVKVRKKLVLELRGELRILDGEVHFVVQPEGTMVEVGRTGDRPDAVDHQDLCMHHPRLVFE